MDENRLNGGQIDEYIKRKVAVITNDGYSDSVVVWYCWAPVFESCQQHEFCSILQAQGPTDYVGFSHAAICGVSEDQG
jgi:hypothetical protein